MKDQLELAPADLASLETLWAAGLEARYEAYRGVAGESRVALAAALVETAIGLQGLGGEVAPAGPLLLGDLCLARASRILADLGFQGLQIAFARAVERVAEDAAAGIAPAPIGPLLVGAMEQGR